MAYKVFLVEDEAAARVGIRENVDWKGAGFEYCGEAPDGDVALPLIESMQPDLLITDIKMPFMDGLQLSKIIRQRMPWVKIVILSGHDEFEYAQAAIKLGVTEYLLKPVTAVNLHQVLQRISTLLDQEREERAQLKRLQSQLQDNLALQREKLLFQLVVGGVSSTEAIEQCQQLGLNIIAPFYQVLLFKVMPKTPSQPLTYDDYQQMYTIVSDLVYPYQGAFLTQKNAEEILLIMTGDSLEELTEESPFIAELVQKEVEEALACTVIMGIGTPQKRLAEISLSFAQALTRVKAVESGVALGDLSNGRSLVGNLKLDQTAVVQYLKCGMENEYNDFYDAHLKTLVTYAHDSYLVKHYLFVDVFLTAAEFINELGGDAAQIIPEIQNIEALLANLRTMQQISDTVKTIFAQSLAFRNSLAMDDRARNMYQVKIFVDNHFADPNLLLNDVAVQANLSPNYFSAVFSEEFGESFKDYLTKLRMERAKELLLTTNLKCSEIAYQSGYNDAHYFSHVFRKNVGLPPQQFRQQTQAKV